MVQLVYQGTVAFSDKDCHPNIPDRVYIKYFKIAFRAKCQ